MYVGYALSLVRKEDDNVDNTKEQRRMSTFMQYAMLATSEALDDAAWRPETDQQRELTVSCDSSNVKKYRIRQLSSNLGRVSRLRYWKSRGAVSDLDRSLRRCLLYHPFHLTDLTVSRARKKSPLYSYLSYSLT